MRRGFRKITIFVVTAAFLANLLACSAFIASTNAELDIRNTWSIVDSLPKSPIDYFGLGSTVAKGKIFLIGSDETEQYDPVSNTWISLIPIPENNNLATVVAFQNKVYVIGGSSDVPTQVYDLLTNSWSNKAAIPKALFGQKAEVVGNKIYVISGGVSAPFGTLADSETTYVYDPSADSWFTMAPIPTPVQYYASAVLDGKIYIMGGESVPKLNDELNASNLVQVFDPLTNQWSHSTPLLFGVSHEGACSTSGLEASKKIYVIGGLPYIYGLGTSADISPPTVTFNQVYDPLTENWSTAASLPDIRWAFSLVNINDTLYVVGGNHYYQSNGVQPPIIGVQATEKYIPLDYTPNDNSGNNLTTIPTTTTVPEVSRLEILPLTMAMILLAVAMIRRSQIKKRDRVKTLL